jgi:hypothetical protein
MSRFKFLDQAHEIEPNVWAASWAARYDGGDNDEYLRLIAIAKQGKLSAADIEQVGRWKEGCLDPRNGRWKTGTPAAYDVWMQAKAELPECPGKNKVADFLRCWSVRTFVAGKRKKTGVVITQSFGLSRSTTLLHFISGGQYPILDSNVVSAMTRLGSPYEIHAYVNSFCPLFSDIASVCGVCGIEGLRKLDNALFMYGKGQLS